MAVKLVNITDRQEWRNYRNKCLGASDIGTLLGLNSFKSILQLWHEKLGFVNYQYTNLKILGGTATESFISDIYRAYQKGNTVEQTAQNIENKKFYRDCVKLPAHAFVVNDEIEYLAVSPDREILNGYVEIKNTSSQYLNSFIDKVSPTHIAQIKTQMMVGEKQHGTLAYLIDGGYDYKEYDFEKDGIIFNDYKNNQVITEIDLKQRITDFWESIVLGRQATHSMRQAKLDFRMDKAQEYQMILDQLEPDPTNDLNYEAYLKDTAYAIARPKIEITGTEKHLELANNYLSTKELLGKAKDNHQLYRNEVLQVCKSGHKIILPDKGFISVEDTKVGVSLKVKI